jgi:hypothetical protein
MTIWTSFQSASAESSALAEQGALARSELEEFESEYTIERFTQRDLMLDLGAILWTVTLIVACVAGAFDPAPTTTLQAIVRFIIAVTSASVAVLMLTLIRRLDDERTLQLVTGLTVLAVCFQFTLSFFGPGALGALSSSTVVARSRWASWRPAWLPPPSSRITMIRTRRT